MSTFKEYEEFLENNGIRASSQRILMLKYLHENRIHPTADTIYVDLSETLPTISKATVYNNLKLFVEKGILRELNINKGEVNYDLVSSDHGHFVCLQCGKIEDFELSDVDIHADCLGGYDIEEKEVIFYGKCKDCAN